MFKTFRLAADARRAHALLVARDAPPSLTLTANVERLLNKVDGVQQMNVNQRVTIREYQTKLRAAEAKIERMTSGLKRGSKQPA